MQSCGKPGHTNVHANEHPVVFLCYWGVQEESWKASDVLFSIPSQHVIIAKPSLDYFFLVPLFFQ